MRVLGLDPGSRRTGYGVVEKRGNAYLCVAHGHVAPPAKATLPERLHHICAHVSEVLARVRPDCVVIEAAFYSKNVRSTLVLGHVRGALMLIAAQQGVEIAEYSPREIKLAVTGNGGADKEQVQAMVSRMLALREELQADAADALAGALCHLSRSRIAPVRTSARGQRAALEALIAKSAVRAATRSVRSVAASPRGTLRGGSRGLK